MSYIKLDTEAELHRRIIATLGTWYGLSTTPEKSGLHAEEEIAKSIIRFVQTYYLSKEAVKEAIPKKLTATVPRSTGSDYGWKVLHHAEGYNTAITDITKALRLEGES